MQVTRFESPLYRDPPPTHVCFYILMHSVDPFPCAFLTCTHTRTHVRMRTQVEAQASTDGRPLPGFTPRQGEGLPLFGKSNNYPAARPNMRIDFQVGWGGGRDNGPEPNEYPNLGE